MGEILTIESDPENVSYDKFVMKFMSAEEDTVEHIPQHLSEICSRFVEAGAKMDAEVIGKRFNSGDELGVQVPVKLRFVGNKKTIKELKKKVVPSN